MYGRAWSALMVGSLSVSSDLEESVSQDQSAMHPVRSGIDHHGVEHIPDEDRTMRPHNVMTTMIGVNLMFGLIVIGYLPVSFGLGWWASFGSILAGAALGAIILAPIATIGPRTGTNGPVSSGAFFGVIGRVVGTLLALFIAIGFYALAVWSGGQVVVYGLHALLGTPDGKVALAVSYVLMAAVATGTAVWGYAMLVRLNRWLIPTAGTLIIVGFLVYAGDFRPQPLSHAYLLGGFWPTWTLAVTISTAATIGYAPYLNDGTRLISHRRHGDLPVAGATSLGLFIGILLPLTFGAFTSLAARNLEVDYVAGLIGASPKWFVVAIVLIGFFGSLGQSAMCLYGNGLDLSSIVRPLGRIGATLVVSAASLVFIFLGTLVWDIESTVSAFLTVLGVVVAAWIGIVVTGHVMARGRYDTADLQVFNEGRTGGRYWFWHGWNLRAGVAFVVASAVGLLMSSTSIYAGPWSGVAGGVDVSWLSAMVIAAVVYGAATVVLPAEADAPRNSVGVSSYARLNSRQR